MFPKDNVLAIKTISAHTVQGLVDESGGLILFYSVYQPSALIKGQKINLSGQLLWGPSGKIINSKSGGNMINILPQENFYYITWHEVGEIYVQKLNPDGDIMWQSGGVKVSNSAGVGFGINNIRAADFSDYLVVLWERSDSLFYGKITKSNGTNLSAVSLFKFAHQTGNHNITEVVKNNLDMSSYFAWQDKRYGNTLGTEVTQMVMLSEARLSL